MNASGLPTCRRRHVDWVNQTQPTRGVASDLPCDLAGMADAAARGFRRRVDDHALGIYRAAVADLDRQHAGRDHWSRFEVDAVLLELADHDGDVDRAVEPLNERERPQYGAIIARLREPDVTTR